MHLGVRLAWSVTWVTHLSVPRFGVNPVTSAFFHQVSEKLGYFEANPHGKFGPFLRSSATGCLTSGSHRLR